MTRESNVVTKVMRVFFIKNNMKLKTCMDKIQELCNNLDYIEKTGNEATVPLTIETVSGWRTGRVDIRNAHVNSIIRFCNSIGCTPNDIIPNPLNPEGKW